MTKFVVVSEEPKKLNEGECVVTLPNFFDEIKLNAGKAGRSNLTQLSHLKEVIGSVVNKYDPDNMMVVYTNIAFGDYVGIPYEGNEGLSNIVSRIFTKNYPTIFHKAIDFQIKNRPVNTKLIYFVGPEEYTNVFLDNGIDKAASTKGNKSKNG